MAGGSPNLSGPRISLYLAWIGYQGWGLDDFHYLRAAKAWATDAPYIGTTHWELRLGMVLPLAASVALFGFNEPALLLVPVFYYLALLAVTYWFVRALVGQSHACISVLVVATVPLVAAWGTTPRVAIAECFYLVVAFWGLAYAAIVPERARRAMIVSGLAFGLAWLSRESALGFAIGLVFLAVLGSPILRSRYIWFAVGALIVIGSEMLFYQVYTGNPFYRLYVDLNHGTITKAGGDGEAARAVVDRAMGRKMVAPESALRSRLVVWQGRGDSPMRSWASPTRPQAWCRLMPRKCQGTGRLSRLLRLSARNALVPHKT
jgi:hypothetical protein